jgi:PAS domain S-box-containing protein
LTAAVVRWYESDMDRSAARRFQAAFLARLGGDQPLRRLFDHLPGVAFCIKDRDSRVVCANRTVLAKFGFTDEADIIGTSDADRYPTALAQIFRASDREVLNHGRSVIDRLEVWYTAEGALDWCVVTKLPLHDRNGAIIGVMLVIRPWSGSRRRLGLRDPAGEVLERIRAAPHLPWRAAALAKRLGVSVRQLHRRVHALVGIGIKEFVLCTRIQQAADLLRHGNASLADIARDCGFHDQSAFTRAFRQRTGTTPERYRRGSEQ